MNHLGQVSDGRSQVALSAPPGCTLAGLRVLFDEALLEWAASQVDTRPINPRRNKTRKGSRLAKAAALGVTLRGLAKIEARVEAFKRGDPNTAQNGLFRERAGS